MSNEREVFFIEQIIYYLKEKFKEISKRFCKKIKAFAPVKIKTFAPAEFEISPHYSACFASAKTKFRA